MDFSESFALQPDGLQDAYSQPGPSKSSGLTLVLPALKGGKLVIKGGKKSKQHRFGPYASQEEEKKAPRPVKLKPLSEVLMKLIAQIKKKDDYAFFLKPVDVSQVQGYLDVVKKPMDLGTMSIKVDRGKYRSLEEFASDLRLVTSNAKAFNPPGSIYYTEAERIESWALDHVAKAASTVIQYEMDWNLEIEKDDEATPVNVEDDEDYSTAMDLDEPGSRRSPSVASQVQPGTTRRGTRGPYNKKPNAPTNKLVESIDAEGRLPGSRDGLGAFPPGSDWANTMVALKLKGKRYKTKKERLRVEKEGPPILPDGSLDYFEMEDPFSVISTFVPDPVTRPYLTPLRPPIFTSPAQYDPSMSQSQSQPSRLPAPFPTPINIPYNQPPFKLPVATTTGNSNGKLRHWTIVRNPTRSKQREKEDEGELPEPPAWQVPREAHATDFGSYALLAGAIEEEIRKRNVHGKEGDEEEHVLQVIRESLDCEVETSISQSPTQTSKVDTGVRVNDYWNTYRAAVAEKYIRDIVYGGADGLAYIRSLAKFVTPNREVPSTSAEGMPLALWVEQNIVDTSTDDRHALLRETALELARQTCSPSTASSIFPSDVTSERSLSSYVRNSLHLYPSAAMALTALLQIKTHKIDMGALIKSPEELFQSEDEWVGKIFKERRKMKELNNKAEEQKADIVAQETEEPEKTWMELDVSSKIANGVETEYELEGPEELREVMEYVADVIVSLDNKIKDKRHPWAGVVSEEKPKASVEADEKAASEDPAIRDLRLNLLALAKRAPLDTIARLPKDLVPEHIRHFIPTLSGPT